MQTEDIKYIVFLKTKIRCAMHEGL